MISDAATCIFDWDVQLNVLDLLLFQRYLKGKGGVESFPDFEVDEAPASVADCIVKQLEHRQHELPRISVYHIGHVLVDVQL